MCCKALGFQIKDFEYSEDNKNKQFAIPGRKFYENPNLWTFIFEKSRIKKCFDFFMEYEGKLYNDMNILEKIVAVHSDVDNWNKIKTILKKHFESIKDEEIKSMDFDQLLLASALNNDFKRFKDLIETFNDIKPLYGTFGNAGNGDAFIEIVRCGKIKNITEMIEVYKADPSINDNLALLIALRHFRYDIALLLVKNGADYHTRNDVCLKLAKRISEKIPKYQEKYNKQFINLFM